MRKGVDPGNASIVVARQAEAEDENGQKPNCTQESELRHSRAALKRVIILPTPCSAVREMMGNTASNGKLSPDMRIWLRRGFFLSNVVRGLLN